MRGKSIILVGSHPGFVAQLVEQRTCNAQVGSSILSVASKYRKNKLHAFQNFYIFSLSSRIVDTVVLGLSDWAPPTMLSHNATTRYDMDQKLTEEQQRSAHKIIVANRGNCAYKGNYLNCWDCPRAFESSRCKGPSSPEFQAENLRRSQAWLDAHITDAEIMAESPREFCERMIRTEGKGKCKGMTISAHTGTCKNCVLFINKICSEKLNLIRAQAYLASHPATPQEPPKRRPTPEEMVVGATVRVRLWDELVRDGVTKYKQNFEAFTPSMKKFCGNTYKIIKRFDGPIFLRVYLEICGADFGQWYFTTDMLDYVEPEKVVDPKPVANAPTSYEIMKEAIRDWNLTPKIFHDVHTAPKNSKAAAKEKSESIVKGDVDKLPLGLLRIINFRDLLPTDALRIIALEGQVDDLTKKLAASARECERQQRRLLANWEAKRDGEMATAEEIEAWFDAGNGSVSLAGEKSKIIPKGHSSWIPATRGNLKL